MPPVDSSSVISNGAIENGQRKKCPWRPPDSERRCLWSLNSDQASPHYHEPKREFTGLKVGNSALDLIGETPIVRLRNIEQKFGIKCELWAKCEYLSVGGSIKDRIAKRMIEDAEREGRIKPGDVIIEPSSGNTGIGLAMVAALKGYRCVICMPEKMSDEKVYVLKGLGAEIVRTPNSAGVGHPDSQYCLADRLSQSIPNSVVLDQYTNPSNPLAHYDDTAEELLVQMGGKIDVLVVSPGTGGTTTGLGRKLKVKLPDIRIVAADPEGSIIAPPEYNSKEKIFFEVEGVGKDFVPTCLDRRMVDKWYKTKDKDSFESARLAMRLEGLLIGGSAGGIVWAAIQEGKLMPEGSRLVMVLPDSIRNYMTKFVDDDWMISRGYLEDTRKPLEAWWTNKKVSDLKLQPSPTLPPSARVKDAIAALGTQHGLNIVPVVDGTSVVAVVSSTVLAKKLLTGKIKEDTQICEVLEKKFQKVTSESSLGQLSLILEKSAHTLVIDAIADDGADGGVTVSVATQKDLLSFIVRGDSTDAATENGK